MDDDATTTLRDLLTENQVASLGTVADGAPFVSMVPFAIASDGSAFFVHVSRLAKHTEDMSEEPRVALMIVESEASGTMAQALARVSIQGTATEMARDSSEYSGARAAYLAKHPESEPMFGFADFSLFCIEPQSARFIQGFGRAFDVTPEELASTVSG